MHNHNDYTLQQEDLYWFLKQLEPFEDWVIGVHHGVSLRYFGHPSGCVHTRWVSSVACRAHVHRTALRAQLAASQAYERSVAIRALPLAFLTLPSTVTYASAQHTGRGSKGVSAPGHPGSCRWSWACTRSVPVVDSGCRTRSCYCIDPTQTTRTKCNLENVC